MPDAPAPPRPPWTTGGSNVSRAWGPQRPGDRRVFPPRPPPPPPRRPPPHGAAAADNGRRGEGGNNGGGAAARGNTGEEAGAARFARRVGGVAEREVEVADRASADPAGAGRNAAAVAAAAPPPPSRVGSKRPAAPPALHLQPPPKRRAVSTTTPQFPPASRRTAAAPARAPLAGAGADAGSRTRYDGERENRPAQYPPPKRRAVFASRQFPPASMMTAAAPAPLTGAGADAGSRTRYHGDPKNRGPDALVEKPAVARSLAARKDGVGVMPRAVLVEKPAVARSLAARKDGVGVMPRAVPHNAAGTRVLNKPYAKGVAAPMANTGSHGPNAGIVKSSAAQDRGRGAGTDEPWGKPMANADRHGLRAGMVKSSAAMVRGRGAWADEPWGKKLLVTATRLPPNTETLSATRTSQPGHGKDGGFGSKVHRPLGSGHAHGALVMPEEMLAADDDSSLADGCAAQIGVAARTGANVGAVTKDGEKGQAPSKESKGYQVSSSAALLDSAACRDVSATDSSGVSGNFGRKVPSRVLVKDVKVMNKYGGSSCRYNTAAASFAKDSSKTTLVRKIEVESGRMNRRASSDVAAGMSGKGNVLRSKDMFTNQNTAKPAKVVQKPVLDTQHIPFSRDKKETVRGRQVTTNGIQDSVELPKDRVMQAHQQRKIASTTASDSKCKLDDSILIIDGIRILRDIKVRDEKLELHLNSSSGLPCVRRQRQYGYRNTDARSRFKTLCRMFEFVCRTLVQIKEQRSLNLRIDFDAAKVMKTKLRDFIIRGPIVGEVPGVEVGDEFLYRSQLAIAGLHHHNHRTGIATTYRCGRLIAISIVASGGYPDELGCPGELIYTGSGGKPAGKKKDEDQKLKDGNLALKNCIKSKTSVRVIHGIKCQNTERDSHLGAKLVSRYTYDGLYQVVDFWMEGQPGSRVFKYKLKRIPGQPELPMHIAERLKTCKRRPGLCMNDISRGKEATPIFVINTVDNVRPATFQYTTRIRYPFGPTKKRQGCDCTSGCSDSVSCACAVKNGGEIPFDLNGRILNDKSVIFECGPSCKCPPSCHNRVSQHDMKIPLEVFRTDKTGWGVRSLRSIPSGTFICEYIGELHQKEAGKRRNNRYLFDVGLNSDDENVSARLLSNVSGLNSSSSCPQTKEDVHFIIDASEYGNIGRFINHSCSPNLQAQNVLWDHDDRRMPHIMFFAAETIPPLQELTYGYNNSKIDRV